MTSTASTSDANSDIHVELEVATLAPTFLPMPGMTDAPKFWEASRFLGEFLLRSRIFRISNIYSLNGANMVDLYSLNVTYTSNE